MQVQVLLSVHQSISICTNFFPHPLENHYPNQPKDINMWYLHTLASSARNNANKINSKEIEYLYQQAAQNSSYNGPLKLLHYILS